MQPTKSRTIIMIDGTFSMYKYEFFELISDVLKTSMARVHQILKKQSANAICELQLCVYRNYNSSEDMILQHSDFEITSEPLIKWISGVEIEGGWGNEAIEVGLQYVNCLEEVDQVIIIGDAEGNTKKETDFKRLYKSFKKVWDTSTRYPKTYFDDELEKIKARKIKIHSFYLNPTRTKKFFEKMSSATGGKSEEFKINSSEAKDQFIHFISHRILENL